MAEYRVPEFEISVASAQPEYVQGESVAVTVTAAYFSGGALANAPVAWRLLAETNNFTWADAPDGRYFNFTPADIDDQIANPYSSFFYGLINEGEGTTDANGQFVIELPVDLAGALASQRWSIDVTVQSPNQQFVSGRTQVTVFPSHLLIGLSPQQYVGTIDEPFTFDVVTITPAGTPLPDAELLAVVYDYRWNSVYQRGSDGGYDRETSVEKRPIYTETIRSNVAGIAQLEWTPDAGGSYYVTLSGEDNEGNASASGIFVWVAAGDASFVPWRRENNDRIEIVADRDLYQPGDTAKVLIPSPFSGPVYALITLERGGILERSVRLLQSNSETIEIPITTDHIPNIYVSVILVKGLDETNPFPAMRLGYVQLPVDAAAKELSVAVATSTETARPGQTVAYTLTVQTSAGDPVADAELSVALIDKAVLSLAEGVDPSLIDRFYYLQPLGVSTGALLVINQDRLSQQLSEGGKGGGGGGGGDGSQMMVRQNFADVADWRADVETDGDGIATFDVTLPDNLTTWRLIARAVTDETLVGETTDDLISTKAVLIRPTLPRFFTNGDRARIGAVIQNNSRADLAEAALTVEVSGGRLQSSGDEPIDLAAGNRAERTWTLLVDETANAVVITYTLAAKDPKLSDAVRLTLPVHRYETPETVATSGVVPPEGRLEAVRVPNDATDSGQLTVKLEPSLAAGMVAGLDYLTHYPYECVEQTVSRFLPNLFTARALQTLGIERPELATGLNDEIEVGLQRLINRQNPDGGWGWWGGMESNRFITGYVLWSLWHAQTAGYAVPETTIANALTFLDGVWMAPADVDNRWVLNEMAFLHFVLAEMGQGDPGRMSTLYDVRERLDHYGRAFLAMALADVDPADSRITTLLDNLAGAAVITATGVHWQEAEIDRWTMNTDLRTTAVVLDAFTRLRPQDPLLPGAVRWLMVSRQNGRWASTQETAWSLIALTDRMVASGELEADYAWRVSLNGEALGQGMVTPQNLDDPVTLRVAVTDLVRDEANALSFSRSTANGNLYYTAHLGYYVDATASAPRDHGLVVSRATYAANGEPVAQAAVGDVISVTVTLQVPTHAYYVLLEVPIPAGTEPIDSSLATESQIYGEPTLEGSGNAYGWGGWVPSHTDIRDEKVALFADYLPAGTYAYTFLVRASLPGEFRVLPAHAQQMYFPEVWGRSSGSLFTVTE